MHRSCAARYFLRLSNSTGHTTNKKSTYPCPACKQEWNKDDVNSILKATKVNEENEGQQSSNGMVNKKQRTSRATDHNNSTNNRSVRSSNRRIIIESDHDDDDDDE